MSQRTASSSSSSSLDGSQSGGAAILPSDFPPPPFYFSHFDTSTAFEPPNLDALETFDGNRVDPAILNTIFPVLSNQLEASKVIGNNNQSANAGSNSSANNSALRKELSTSVDQILKISLSMVSSFPPYSGATSIEDMNAQLMSLVSSFHEKLAGYREKEATELLRREMKKQLEEAKLVRDRLQELLTKYGEK